VTERSVDTLIKRLRRKVEEDPAEPRLLQTVWGDGYKFADG
jgi:two-component system OmpR family response regulator